jgi:hypothetical protein
MNDDPILEQTLDTFFSAATMPANNHEEWLLRTCSHLMHREAAVVSFMEHSAKQAGANRGYRKKRDTRCLPPQARHSSYRASEASTSQSEETDAQLSSES